METVRVKAGTSARTRSVAFVGLTIALMAVSAWVVVPLGPVPFTLQMFAITFAVVVLSPKEAAAAIAGYLLLGAVGVPVFSGMRGGVGVLAGPTGGFLWGYLIGVPVASLLLHALRSRFGAGAGRDGAGAAVRGGRAGVPSRLGASVRDAGAALGGSSGVHRAAAFLRRFGAEVLAGVVFTVIAYGCGCVQYMAVGHVDFATAFLTAVAPFMILDAAKIVAAVVCADAVRAAVK